MSDRLPWFRCFPSALLGALAGLQADEGFLYAVALMRIYETGGPVVETARTLARRTGMTERRADKALQELVSLGKLTILPSGQIDAESTHDEIEWQQATRQKNSAAGKSSAAKRAGKTQQNQRNAATTVERAFNHKRVESKDTPSLRSGVCETPDGATPKKGSTLPGDWAPKESHLAKAAERKFPATFVAHQAERMRDWALGNSNRAIARKADWDRTFNNWLGEAMDKAAPRTPPPNSQTRRSGQSLYADIAREAHEQLTRSEAHASPFDATDPEILPPGPGAPSARYGHLSVYERPGSEAWDRNAEDDPRRVRAFG